MVTVLLAIDEGEHSIYAAEKARELFGDSATYLAVNVADRPVLWASTAAWGGVYPYVPPYPLVTEDLTETLSDAEKEARRTAQQASAAAGVVAEPLGDVGDAPTAILDAADEHGADVIVVGTSDKGWWRRLVEGSVAQEVIRESNRPVLVVHPVVERSDDDSERR